MTKFIKKENAKCLFKHIIIINLKQDVWLKFAAN